MIEPIIIDNDFSNKDFELVSTLVDRDDFREDIDKLRQSPNLNLKQLFDRNKVDREIEKRVNYLNYLTDKNTPISDIKPYRHGENKIYVDGRCFEYHKYRLAALPLLKKYHKSINFQNIISFALSCGEILVKDFIKRDPQIRIVNRGQKETQIILHEGEAAIIFPYEQSLKGLQDTITEYFFNSKTNYVKRAAQEKNIDPQWDKSGTHSQIKKYRRLYWEWKNRSTSYEEFLNKQAGLENMTPKAIEAAVKKYKNSLK